MNAGAARRVAAVRLVLPFYVADLRRVRAIRLAGVVMALQYTMNRLFRLGRIKRGLGLHAGMGRMRPRATGEGQQCPHKNSQKNDSKAIHR